MDIVKWLAIRPIGRLNTPKIARGLTREQFELALHDASIPFTTIEPDYDPNQRLVTTQSAATFTFVEDSDDNVSGLVAWILQDKAEHGDQRLTRPEFE